MAGPAGVAASAAGAGVGTSLSADGETTCTEQDPTQARVTRVRAPSITPVGFVVSDSVLIRHMQTRPFSRWPPPAHTFWFNSSRPTATMTYGSHLSRPAALSHTLRHLLHAASPRTRRRANPRAGKLVARARRG